MKNFLGTLCLIFLFTLFCFGNSKGIIKGKLYDSETKQPLVAANILIVNTNIGAATDEYGQFEITNIPAGTYSLRFSYIGYNSKVVSDVIVRPDRITFLNVEITPGKLQSDSIVVSSGYFSESEKQPVSATMYSYEEIRRAPGSGGDISRIVMGLPSVAKTNDQSNGLIVRGGSPMENSFYIDNIEIPNINHFPSQGNSSGPIGMLNVDFIENVDFYAGGFGANYGDRLSSIMEISLREGNRSEFDGQLDLNFTGAGGVFEGPLKDKGSWLISVRRSYLDWLINAIDAGTSIAPVYSDYQWKLVYDLSNSHKISFIGLLGRDHSEADQENAAENEMTAFGSQDYFVNTTGFNWLAIWDKRGFSNTSISVTSLKYDEVYFRTGPGNLIFDNNSTDLSLKIRNTNHFQLNRSNQIEFGLDVKFLSSKFRNVYGQNYDLNGNIIPENHIEKKLSANKIGMYFSYISSPVSDFTATLGVRADYFSFNKIMNVAPKLSFKYSLSRKTALTGAAGIYYQTLPLNLLAQNGDFTKLKNMRSAHIIAGIEYLLSESTKLKLEMYEKLGSNFPVDPVEKDIFLFDEILTGDNFFGYHENLVSTGKTISKGVELTIQKKLAKNFYGIAGVSYFITKYKTNLEWINRVVDNRIVINFEGGYKLNNKWEFSAKWIYAGGAPFTPFNIAESKEINLGIPDNSKINTKRYPDYHSLNLRVDRRFLFDNSNIIVYFSVWNAYNRKNIAHYYWNETENKQDEITQWSLLPIFGIEYEF